MGPGVMDSPPNGRSSDAQANQWPLGRLRHWLQRIQGNRQARNSAQDLRGAEAVAETHNRELQRSQAEATRLLERFRAFFATLPLAALIVDDKGLILEANQAAEQLFELPDDHLRRHLFTGLIDEADRDTAIEALSSDWETHRADLIEIGLHSVFGRPIVADLHIARLPGRLGGGHQSVCALVDRSQAVTQRRALREQAESLRHHRAELAERLLELCAQPRSLTTGELSVTASLGISVYPSNGEDGETLLRYAGVALNRAKERGPNAFEFFEQAMETEAVTRLQLESD